MADPQLRYKTVPLTWADLKEHVRLIAHALNGILRAGHINATGQVTLASGATSTTVTRDGVTAESVVVLTPASANAAAVTYYLTATKGSFTINHASGITGADFHYVFFG